MLELFVASPMINPIRILELRCTDGSGGGPEKTILLGAKQADAKRYEITICYIRSVIDDAFDIDRRARELGVDFAVIKQRHRFDPAIWRQAKRLVRDKRIDIVHSHDYKTNLIALMLARSEGIIPLSTAHGYTGHSRLERRVYYPADRRLLKYFPMVVAVSSDLRNELIRSGCKPDHIRTVLNGIDHLRFRRDHAIIPELRRALGIKPGEIALGGVGRVEPQKRFDILLQGLAILRRRLPSVRLFIAGEGSLRVQLEFLAQKLNISHACRFLGNCGDLGRIYPALDVLVQSSEYEGTPNVVLEAMAFETPIVATNVGGTAELVQDGVHALVVPPHDPDALASAVEKAIRDRDATTARVTAARKRIENELSFASRMRTVEGIYDEMMTLNAHRRQYVKQQTVAY